MPPLPEAENRKLVLLGMEPVAQIDYALDAGRKFYTFQ
jgi:hypothetical protein